MSRIAITKPRLAILFSMASILLLSACQKEGQSSETPLPQEFAKMVFEASLEGEDTDVKTQRKEEDGSVLWTPGDAVSVFFGTGTGGGMRFVAQTTVPSATTPLAGTINVVEGGSEGGSNTVDYFWAAYPYDESISCDGETLTLTMPSQQLGVANTFQQGSALMIARSLGLKLAFKNVWSCLRLYVSEAGYTSITIRGNNNEVLAGRVRVGFNDNGTPEVREILDGETTVTLLAPEGGFIPGVRYFLPVLPTLLPDGFTLELSSTTQVGTWVRSGTENWTRNNYKGYANLETKCTVWSERTITRASFSDANFADYVFDNFDLDSNGILSAEERNAVENISVFTGNISSLQGIEFFPNLVGLDAHGGWNDATSQWEDGQLTSLNLSHNPLLQNLSCHSNQLTSLDLSNNAALEMLYCDANQLSSLDLSHSPLLQHLSCDSNQLTSLDLSACPSLYALSCYSNQLTSLDLSACPDLQNLSCGNNPLSSFDISALTELVSLNCSNLSLNSLDVSHLANLNYLDCTNNPLGTLDVSNNPKLQTLNCGECDLTVLDLTECPLLGFLNCHSNQLTSLDISPCFALYYLYALENPLTTLYIFTGQTVQDMDLPDGVTVEEKAVESWDIDEVMFPDAQFRAYILATFDQNGDGKFTRHEMLAVTNIYVCTDDIASLEGIARFPNLTSLHCYGSNYDSNTAQGSGILTSLDLSQNTALEYLNCEGNGQLTSLDLSLNTALQSVFAGYCNALQQVELPSTLASIGDLAFYYCGALSQIRIPASVTSIGTQAFEACTALARVSVEASTPPQGAYGMFDNTGDCPICVPEAAVDAYKNAAFWQDYAGRIGTGTLGSGNIEGVGYDEW